MEGNYGSMIDCPAVKTQMAEYREGETGRGWGMLEDVLQLECGEPRKLV